MKFHRRILLCLVVWTLGIGCGGCQSIRLGGSGSIGGVHGSGGISIPVPHK